MNLTCPKCQGTMRHYERNGVMVDQCGDCRGIFLDRGELERLVDAESRWNAGARDDDRPRPDRDDYRPRPDRDDYRPPRSDDYRPPKESYGYGSSGYGHKGHKRPKSFLEQLFD